MQREVCDNSRLRGIEGSFWIFQEGISMDQSYFCWQLRKFSCDPIHSTALPALRFGFLGLKTFLHCIAVFPSSASFLHHPFIIQSFILSRSCCGGDRVSLRNATLLLCKILSHQLEISQGKKTFWKFLLELRLKNYFQHYFVITSKMFNPSLFFAELRSFTLNCFSCHCLSSEIWLF